MATKVNNSTAQKKWDSLKGSAGVSLSRIVQGSATSSDFQRVQNVLNQQSSLASQVFAQAVSAAEVQAKKFEKSYMAVLDKDNKELLSQFEVAMNSELRKITPDIVGQLKEIIEMSVLQSNEDLDKSISGKFESLREWMPKEKDVPTVHDLLAANDLLAERVQSDMDLAWGRREQDLLDKIADVFEGTLRNLAERINKEKAERARSAHGAYNQAHGGNVPLLGHSGGAVPMLEHQAVERPSILSQGMSLLRGPEAAGAAAAVAAQGGSQAATTGSSTMVVALSPAAQHELTTAAGSQKEFYDRVKALLPAEGQKGHGDAEEEGKEEKKADTWWRSFKNWFGDDEEKKKKKSSDKFGWIKDLGAMLSLMILNPKLFQTIGQELKKLLTWENLRGAAEKTWDWVKGMTSSVMEAISNMLGGTMKSPTQTDVRNAKSGKKDLATTKAIPGDKKHADINNLTPAQKKQMADMDKANKEGSEGPGWINSALSMVGVNTPAMKDYNLAHTDSNPNSKTYGHIIIGGQDKGKNPDFTPQTSVTNAASSAGAGRSSVKPPLPASMPTGSNASTTFSEAPSVKYSPGVSLPSGSAPGSTAAGGSAAMQPQKGAPQMGIGSFGFNAANSDSLTLMNTYHFTAG
jgi:hypothetical protein